MKFAQVECTNPNCRATWAATVRDGQMFSQCDDCGQMNNVPEDAPRIMDVCPKCHRAFEDHDTASGRMVCWSGKKEIAK